MSKRQRLPDGREVDPYYGPLPPDAPEDDRLEDGFELAAGGGDEIDDDELSPIDALDDDPAEYDDEPGIDYDDADDLDDVIDDTLAELDAELEGAGFDDDG